MHVTRKEVPGSGDDPSICSSPGEEKRIPTFPSSPSSRQFFVGSTASMEMSTGGADGRWPPEGSSKRPAVGQVASGGKRTALEDRVIASNLVELEKTYAAENRPSEGMIFELARRLDMTYRKVETWFIYRRHKDRRPTKRRVRRRSPEPPASGSSSGSNQSPLAIDSRKPVAEPRTVAVPCIPSRSGRDMVSNLAKLEKAYTESKSTDAMKLVLAGKMGLTYQQVRSWFYRRHGNRERMTENEPPLVRQPPASQSLSASNSRPFVEGLSHVPVRHFVGAAATSRAGKPATRPLQPMAQQHSKLGFEKTAPGEPSKQCTRIFGVDLDHSLPGMFSSSLEMMEEQYQIPIESKNCKVSGSCDPELAKKPLILPIKEHHLMPLSASRVKEETLEYVGVHQNQKLPSFFHEYQFFPQHPSLGWKDSENVSQPHGHALGTRNAEFPSPQHVGEFLNKNEQVPLRYIFQDHMSSAAIQYPLIGSQISSWGSKRNGAPSYDHFTNMAGGPQCCGLEIPFRSSKMGSHSGDTCTQVEREYMGEEATSGKDAEAHEE